MVVCGQLPAQCCINRGRATSTHGIAAWIGPRTRYDTVENTKITCPIQIMIKQFSSLWPNHCADIIPALLSIQFVITLCFVILLYLDTEIKMKYFISKMLYNMYRVTQKNGNFWKTQQKLKKSKKKKLLTEIEPLQLAF